MSDTDQEKGVLHAEVEEREGAIIVRVAGKIIRENQAELRGRLESLIAGGARGVALDLVGVTYMDSAGLGCCASVSKKMRESSGKNATPLAVFNASPNIAKMWKLIRLDLVIPICADEKEALRRIADAS